MRREMKRIRIVVIWLCMLLFTLTACGKAAPSPEVAENAASRPTTDPSGASVVIPDQVDSVVALAPSICETLTALGVEEKITGYDLQSVGIAGLPENVPTFDTVNPDVEQLTALAPDILFV